MTAKDEQMAEQINAGEEINETLEVITSEYNPFENRLLISLHAEKNRLIGSRAQDCQDGSSQ
jgi:hypothetical protein